jgi:hypothetical protein
MNCIAHRSASVCIQKHGWPVRCQAVHAKQCVFKKSWAMHVGDWNI